MDTLVNRFINFLSIFIEYIKKIANIYEKTSIINDKINVMIKSILRTNIGYVQFTGKLDKNTEYIFSFGYCANFAKILSDNRDDLNLAYIQTNDEIDHWFCVSDDEYIYDIMGKHCHDDFYNIYNYSTDSSIHISPERDDIKFCKLYQKEYDIYAKMIVKEYMEKWFPIF